MGAASRKTASRQKSPDLASVLGDTVGGAAQIQARTIARVTLQLSRRQWGLARMALEDGIKELEAQLDPNQDVTQLAVMQIGLPVKIANALEDSLGIVFVHQLLEYTPTEVARQPNLAEKAVELIRQRLQALNLRWPMPLAERVELEYARRNRFRSSSHDASR